MLKEFIEDGGYALVGQNLVGFDAAVLMHEFDRHKCKNFVFNSAPIVDVGVAYKAYQLHDRRAANEGFWAYFRRVRAIRAKGVKWSIVHCMKMFHLPVDSTHAHNAEYDCMCAHQVYEKMREQEIIEKVLWPGRYEHEQSGARQAAFRPGGGV
ncbi:MAG TPA: hypothetical protein ENH11_01130 [Candidatus Acetothermia bacterium]|nr:hypothetical protein [Candidatus Acetothermia bacterium]